MAIRLSENFRALFYAPFYAAHAIGAYQAEGVDVSCCLARSCAHRRRAARGEIDVMWGGPLRVMLTHAQDPAADSVCFCDVIARDPFFIIGREPRPDFQRRRSRRASASPRWPRCRRRGCACRTTCAAPASIRQA